MRCRAQPFTPRTDLFPKSDYSAWNSIMANNQIGGTPKVAHLNTAIPSQGEIHFSNHLAPPGPQLAT
ncbi:hypothetical protein JCM31598_27500 [Desulfonatronum parangueonense]